MVLQSAAVPFGAGFRSAKRTQRGKILTLTGQFENARIDWAEFGQFNRLTAPFPSAVAALRQRNPAVLELTI